MRATAPADGIDLGAYDAGDVLVERVAPRPSLFVRLRALLVLAAVVATIGALVALAVSTGITTLSRALESTVS